MKYSVEVYDKALDTIKERYNKALETHNFRVAEMRIKAPEVAKLSDSLSNTYIEMTKAIINGGDNTTKLVEEIKNNNLETQRTIRQLLKEFNYSEDYLEIPYTCKICKDSGSVNGVRCQCFLELLKKYAVDDLNSKSKIKLHDFDEFRLEYYPIKTVNGFAAREQMMAVYEYSFDYADKFNTNSPSLLFIGGTGLGKTFLSSAIAKKLSENGFSVVFDSISNIMRVIENERFGRSDGDTIGLIYEADLVILDDLGSEFITNFTSSALYTIINERMNSSKPVILSTNFTISELNEKYNERIISRISSFTPIHFAGNDIRQIILKK